MKKILIRYHIASMDIEVGEEYDLSFIKGFYDTIKSMVKERPNIKIKHNFEYNEVHDIITLNSFYDRLETDEEFKEREKREEYNKIYEKELYSVFDKLKNTLNKNIDDIPKQFNKRSKLPFEDCQIDKLFKNWKSK